MGIFGQLPAPIVHDDGALESELELAAAHGFGWGSWGQHTDIRNLLLQAAREIRKLKRAQRTLQSR